MLPKTIFNRYLLYREVKSQRQSSSEKGLYIDKKTNTKVFIKVNTNGDQLLSEYVCQQIFYEQAKKLKTENIVIPKPLSILEVDGNVALVTEYILGEPLLRADVKVRLDTYTTVLNFLEKINREIPVNRRHGLRRKSAITQLSSLPYFLLKNIILYPFNISLFLHSVGLIFNLTVQWAKLTSNWISHGDINVTNILLSDKKVVVVDFANTCISHRFFDISRVLNSTWYQREFHEQFWNRIICEFRYDTQQQNLLKSFVVFNLMQRLSQRYANPNQESFYLKRLERILAIYEKR